jgi:predicted PurR-regulated permease PerM
MTAENWFYILGIVFFVVNTLFFIVMAFVMFKLVQVAQNIQPKVEQLTNRVESIGQQVEELSENVKTTVSQLGGRAQSVATSVDNIAHVASRQFEKFSPFIVGAMTAIRLVKALNEVRQGRSIAKATTQKNLDPEKKAKDTKLAKR